MFLLITLYWNEIESWAAGVGFKMFLRLRLKTMLESLHVLDLYFPPELSILKLPFFMKHPVGSIIYGFGGRIL